jgi:hypothetical protein
MTSEKFSIVLEAEYKEPLENLALEHVKAWGKRGNVKALIKKIALREIPLAQSREEGLLVEITQKDVGPLMQSVRSHLNMGQAAVALELSEILLRCPNLPKRVIEELETLSQLAVQNVENQYFWQVRQFILKQMPFKMRYQKGGGKIDTYTICYAHLEPTPEERIPYYLCAWVSEPSSSPEATGLEHNRSFRCDRILEVTPLSNEEWRHQGMDWIEVKFLIRGDLAKSYEAKKWDIDSEMTNKGKLVRRRVWSLWWFVNRDILRYGSRAIVLSPPEARKMIQEELQSMTRAYEENSLNNSN